jgi:2-dehydropantoate 2-reductase
MKILVMGTGGVGGYFGGLLAKAQEEVYFVARGAHFKALKECGLSVKSVVGDFSLRVTALEHPAEAGYVDLVLFCVKTYDTEEAARQILPTLDKHTMVLTVQNGVDNGEKIGKIVGEEPVITGTVYIESTVSAPGVISQTAGPRKIIFGELNGSITDRVRRVLDTFQKAGIICELSEDIRKTLWSKFVFICAASGLTGLTRTPMREAIEFPQTREIFIKTLKESIDVATGLGVSLDSDLIDRILGLANSFNQESKASLLRDLESDKRVEAEALNGTVVRLGKELSIPTPVNEVIYACLKLADERNKARVNR